MCGCENVRCGCESVSVRVWGKVDRCIRVWDVCVCVRVWEGREVCGKVGRCVGR